jgi:replicative DNA helicase
MDTVFTPQQSMTLAINSVEERKVAGSGMTSGVPGLDDVMLPMKRGDLMVVLGYTSNGKSLLMSAIANHALSTLEPGTDEVVIYISWEQSVEEQTLLDISRMSRIPSDQLYRGTLDEPQWFQMVQSAIKRATQPLWLIGHSDAAEKRRPRLSMTDVALALEYIVDVQKKKPVLILLDYLQRINRSDCKSADNRFAYMDIVDRIKDMALAFTTPVILGCQAGRNTQDKEWRMPNIDDGQETSNIEQSADKFVSVWMPKTNLAPGHKLEIPGTGGMKVPVSDNLFLLELWKNKYGKAPRLFGLYAKPEIGRLYKLDMHTGGESI